MPYPFRMIALAAARTLGISFPTVADALMGRTSREACDRRLDEWSRDLLADVDMRLDILGREHLPQGRGPVVFMSNHQSLYDIPVLYRVLPPSLRMVAKKELFRVPVWGDAMKASGFIKVDRQNRQQAFQDLELARAQLRSGISVWIAPEGTRSRDGSLLPFKKGGFVIAEQLGLPIIPISICGTRDVLPAKTWELNRGVRVAVTIHPPVDSSSQRSGRDVIVARVREAIASGLAK